MAPGTALRPRLRPISSPNRTNSAGAGSAETIRTLSPPHRSAGPAPRKREPQATTSAGTWADPYPEGFSQRLSGDHLVLELDEDEGGLGNVADLAGAERDALEGPPALGQQGEAPLAEAAQRAQQGVAGAGGGGPPARGQQGEPPLAEAAQRAQQRVAGAGVKIGFPAARWLPYRDVDAVACAFVPGVGQHRQDFQVGPQDGEQVLAGGGDVVDAAGQDRRDP